MSDPLIIVQARMGSTRLPGKVLLPIGGIPAILHTLTRCQLSGYQTVLAIPDSSNDLDLCSIASHAGFRVFVVPIYEENDVLGRYFACAKLYEASTIIRVTGDCPFVQPEDIRRIGHALSSDPDIEYVSNCYNLSGDRVAASGWDVEGFRYATLACIAEHVTWAFRMGEINTQYIEPQIGYDLALRIRTTLDTPEDYAWLQKVASLMDVTPPHPTAEELAALVTAHPELQR